MAGVLDYNFDRQEVWRKRRKKILKVLIWIICIAAACAAAYFTVKYSVERTNMVGSSMEPTLNRDDTIIINKLSYFRSDPKRYDIIVYKAGGEEHDFYTIKRVIGLPGETVQIIGGEVFIDGVKLDEPMNVEKMVIAGLAQKKLTLDEDEYFVLGDNRNSSEDSRFANVGTITRDRIVGEAWVRTNSFGFISKFNMKEETPEEAASLEETPD